MSLAEEPTKNDSLLTEKNLALSAAKENQIDDRSRSGKSVEDNDTLSELSKIDSNSNIAQVDLDLDGYYISSDAETEKMEDEPAGHVVLSALAQDNESVENAEMNEPEELGFPGFVEDATTVGEPSLPQDDVAQTVAANPNFENQKESDLRETEDVPGSIVKDAESEAILNQELKDKPTFESVPDDMSMGMVDAGPKDTPDEIQKEESMPNAQSNVEQLPEPSHQQDIVIEEPLKIAENEEVEVGGDTATFERSEANVVNSDNSGKGNSTPENQTEPEIDNQNDHTSQDTIPQIGNQPSNPTPYEAASGLSMQKDNKVSSVDGSTRDLSEENTSSVTTEMLQEPPQEYESNDITSAKDGLKGELVQNDEKSGMKREFDEAEDTSQFKKPRPPPSDFHKDGENDDDNDADEDEDEAEDEILDKTDLNDALANITSKDVLKKSIATDVAEVQSPVETESIRLMALKEITEIEHQFAELRQKLYESKLAKLQTETQMCLDGSHPALQSYYQKIDSVRDFKLRRAYQRQRYELECIDKETKATRCCIHQDFLRKVSNVKHEMLFNTTQKWYDINKERREINVVVPDVNYHVPVKIDGKTLSCITGYAAPAQLRREGDPLSEDLQCEGIKVRYKNNPVDKLEVIVDRMRFNNELSDLEGLKRFFNGFPGAPNLSGLKDSEVFEDLQKLQRSI
ncbi:Rpd3L histone deacetylase complex subunit DEP1 LALA0_S09e06986g [Lachancea lanzarotensis]|uniref:LALA0S09e06986g1_1 n=1 Tax=Lachancea lanzarotensis TaxID=1245769 RepID=A0A0C7N7W9_9SACH|nr:uncharacterized protein LALA0_S09e06986g [Lachancea lanzarotensis]CEP63983.1 LALA0S09e06986g1_1 [Lachancea lanzarotensis]